MRPAARAAALPAAMSVAMSAAAPAAAETFETSAGPVEVTEIAGGLDQPWGLAFLPDGRMLVTEKAGRLRLIEDGRLSDPIAGVPEVVDSGQGGLLDVAVSPDFAATGTIFLSYAEPAGRGRARTAVARATLSDGRLVAPTVIFRQNTPGDTGRHFGSRIVIAADGNLFVTTGDRGERGSVQDLSNHRGAVIRIAPDGSIPADNPEFAGGAPGLWSKGHRNPQGAALDAEGRLWTVEHGARGGDEINRPEAGLNYGWPVISYGRHYSGFRIGEGTAAPGYEQPKFHWDPSIAPSGLAVYSGGLFPEWEGDLLVGALKFQLISRLEVTDGEVTGVEERLLDGEFGRIRDVDVGPGGAIWFVTDEDPGGVYRMAPANPS